MSEAKSASEAKRKKIQKKSTCKCLNYKVIADYRNDMRDPRGKVIQCQDCGRIFE